jgi:hypothetical protein
MNLLALFGFGGGQWIVRKKDKKRFEPHRGGAYINRATGEVLLCGTVQDILMGDFDQEYEVTDSMSVSEFLTQDSLAPVSEKISA